MSRETHVRFCEQLRVKIPGLTRLSDSVSGAEASSMFYSFVVSAKINGFDPYEVLLKIFDLVPFAKTIEDYEQLADLIVPRSLPS